MNIKASTVLVIVGALLSASCAQSISKSDETGKLTIAFGGPRALETGWPGGTVPAFGPVTVTVSASDMDTVTVSSNSSSGSLTIEIPAGANRLVEIAAVPASAGSVPFFAKAYGGSALVDVEAGEQKAVTIKLGVSESKLLLPGTDSSSISGLFVADSIDGSAVLTAVPLENDVANVDASLDDYGRLFFFEDFSLFRATENSADPEFISLSTNGLAGTTYSPFDRRLYYYFNNIYYADMSAATPVSVQVNPPAGVTSFHSAFAADDEGYLYAFDGSNHSILKLSVNGTTATTIKIAQFESVGLTYSGTNYLPIADMQVHDDVLYIAAREVNFPATSRGKVVAVSTSTLSLLWETGWAGDSQPAPTSPTTQFYGPQRFVGFAPKRLYLIDDGFNNLLTQNVDRVVELNLETRAISKIGVDGVLDFFENFSW